jgi:uncharacterized membrane protein YgcG
MKLFAASWVLLFAICACTTHKEKPHIVVSDCIFDSANLLTTVQRDSVFQIIHELDSAIGSQMGVNIISSLRGRKIDEYSLEVANNLGLGRRQYNDGILLTVALEDRKMRIEVGIGLESIVKDETAARINRNIIAPQFSEGNYCKGIYLALDSMKYLIERDRTLIGREN